jgi:hypothetical protein
MNAYQSDYGTIDKVAARRGIPDDMRPKTAPSTAGEPRPGPELEAKPWCQYGKEMYMRLPFFARAFAIGIAIGCLFMAASGQKKPERSKSVSAVAKTPALDYKALEKEWLRAQDEGDVPVLAQMYDDDFIGTTFTGKLLSRGNILPEDEGPIEPKTRSVLEDIQGRTYGQAAITLGQVNSGGLRYRFTKVYVFRDGTWKLVTAHLSRVQ